MHHAALPYLKRSTHGDLPATMSYSVLRLLPCMAVEKTNRKSCIHGSTPGFFTVNRGISSYRSLSLSLRGEEIMVQYRRKMRQGSKFIVK